MSNHRDYQLPSRSAVPGGPDPVAPGFAVLNVDKFIRPARRSMRYLFLLEPFIAASASISFQRSQSTALQGNLHDIRIALLAVAAYRYPLDLFHDFGLVRDLPALPAST